MKQTEKRATISSGHVQAAPCASLLPECRRKAGSAQPPRPAGAGPGGCEPVPRIHAGGVESWAWWGGGR